MPTDQNAAAVDVMPDKPEVTASEAYAAPYEGNEDMWAARPREGAREPEAERKAREAAWEKAQKEGKDGRDA